MTYSSFALIYFRRIYHRKRHGTRVLPRCCDAEEAEEEGNQPSPCSLDDVLAQVGKVYMMAPVTALSKYG